ncbi:MAG: TonB-dependent receptor plug domain-containing protein [Luteitalea sp.]|nr:TonB-dependent receptor plug domain-containing protein [Luteitalea sp.]
MRLRNIGVVLLALVLGSILPAGAQERFGGLAGVVTDTSMAPVPGATITVTNKQSGASRTIVSGGDGSFRMDLEPGRYSVSVELQGFQKVQVDDMLILLGRTVDFPARLTVGALSETVNVTAEAEKQIDLRSTAVAHNVTSEEFDRMPKARSFQGIALTAPSVNQGQLEGGFQVNGASGAENSFTVDGVTTNSLVNGKSRQETVFEYLQEVQVKTAGIEAEYGGALGGVISAVTKSGGNQFRGEAHYFYDGNGLSATPVKRLVLDPSNETTVSFVQDDKQVDNRNEFGGSIGGPIVRDRLFFFGSYSPRVVRRTNDYAFSSGAERGSVDQERTDQQAFGKLTYSTGRLQANASVLFTPTRVKGTLLDFDGAGPQFYSSPMASYAANIDRGWEQDQTSTSGSVDYFLTSSSSVSVRGGYFYDNYADTDIPSTGSVTWNNSNAVNDTRLPASLRLPVNAFNTPRALNTVFDKTKRGFMNADYNQSFNRGGEHLLKAGLGFQKVSNPVETGYPGGYVLLNWNATFPATATVAGGTGTYGYYEVNDRGTTGTAGSTIYSLYIQDQWTVGSRLTLNLGVRTENETIPTFRPEIKKNAIEFGFADKIAPRLGATYDLRGDGRVKLYGSWGRYYDWTKYELARGSFGGDFWDVYYRSLDTLDVTSLNLSNMPGRDLWRPAEPNSRRDRRAPSINNVDPDIEPMYQDSVNAGVEYQLNPTSVLGVHYIHNDLKQTIEDLGAIVNGNEEYVIGNPGSGLGAITPVSGRTLPFATPKPKRTYDALELTFSRRFSNSWFGSASYTYSRLYGNYAGLASSDEIVTPTTGTSSAQAQQQTGNVARQGGNANRAWDLDELLFDSRGNLDVLGRLATDRPHVVKLYGSYQFPFGTQVGGFFYGGTGTPISTYVVTTNQIPVFANGRGDMGRTPFLNKTDLLVSHELNLMQNKRIRFELNILNVFNQKTATHIFNYLNRGAGLARGDSAIDLSRTNLMAGYDYNALILASPSGARAYDNRYGEPDLFQTGTQGQLSVKFLF